MEIRNTEKSIQAVIGIPASSFFNVEHVVSTVFLNGAISKLQYYDANFVDCISYETARKTAITTLLHKKHVDIYAKSSSLHCKITIKSENYDEWQESIGYLISIAPCTITEKKVLLDENNLKDYINLLCNLCNDFPINDIKTVGIPDSLPDPQSNQKKLFS